MSGVFVLDSSADDVEVPSSMKSTPRDEESAEAIVPGTLSKGEYLEYTPRLEKFEEVEDNEATPSREKPESDSGHDSSESDQVTASREPVPNGTSNPEKTPRNAKASRPKNPISWYGVLVPPSLRKAQKSFTEAVEVSVPDLASTVSEMQCVEAQVVQLRKRIGLSETP